MAPEHYRKAAWGAGQRLVELQEFWSTLLNLPNDASSQTCANGQTAPRRGQVGCEEYSGRTVYTGSHAEMNGSIAIVVLMGPICSDDCYLRTTPSVREFHLPTSGLHELAFPSAPTRCAEAVRFLGDPSGRVGLCPVGRLGVDRSRLRQRLRRWVDRASSKRP